MKKKLRENKRTIAGVIAAILIVVMVLGMVAPFLTVFGASNTAGKIMINGQVGFDKVYKINGSTPFRIQLSNSGDSFKGELQIKINISEDNYSRVYNVFSYPVELPPGGSKSIELEIEIPVIKTSHKAVLVDDKGKEVASKTLTCSAIEPYSVLAGILTDDKNSLNYFRQLTLFDINSGERKLSDRLVLLDETTFPSSGTSITNFDMIIINDFDTGRLSQESINSISAWVESGGLLVIGTGQNFNKIFNGISGVFDITESGTKTLRDFTVKAINTDEDAEININSSMYTCILDIPGSVPLVETNEQILMAVMRKGRGSVLVHSYDMGTSPAPDLFNEFKPLQEIYKSELEGLMDAKSRNNYNYNNNNMGYMVDNLPSLNNGTIIFIFIIIFIYAVIAGPIMYLILKKKDIREKGFVIIPVFAVAVSLVLFFLSFDALYKKPIVNTVSKIILNGSAPTADIKVGVFSPKKGDVTVSFSKNINAKLNNSPYYSPYYYRSSMYMPSTAIWTGTQQWVVNERDSAKLLLGDLPSIVYFDKASWDSNYFAATIPVNMQSGLDGSFHMDGNTLKGTLTNNTGYDLEDVLVGIGASLEKYKTLKNTETIDVEQQVDLKYNGDFYTVISNLFDAYGYNNYSDIKGEERRQNYFRRNLLNDQLSGKFNSSGRYYSSSYTSYSSSSTYSVPMAVSSSKISSASSVSSGKGHMEINPANNFVVGVYAFNTDKLFDSNITVDNQMPTEIYTNLIETSFPLLLDEMENFDLPFGILGVSSISSDMGFDNYGTSVYAYAAGTMEFMFSIPQNLNIELFQFKKDDTSYLPVMSATQIYNVVKDEWEDLQYTEYHIGKIKSSTGSSASSNGGDYINKDGKIILRVAFDSPANLTMPEIRIKGGK